MRTARIVFGALVAFVVVMTVGAVLPTWVRWVSFVGIVSLVWLHVTDTRNRPIG